MADKFGADAAPRAGLFERHFPTLGGVFKFFLAVIAVLIVAFLVTVVVFNIVGSRRLRDARARAGKAGVPLTSKEFYLKYPQPMDEENAANYYRGAFLILETVGRQRIDYLLDPDNGAPEYATDALSDEYVEALRRLPSDYRFVIELLKEGANLPRCSYHVDCSDVNADLDHLPQARVCARLLSLGVLLASLEGRGEDGVALARDGLTLSRSLEREPGVVASLVGMAISSITLSQNLQRLVSSCEISDGQLAALQKDLERCDADFSVRPGLEGELVQLCATFEGLAAGKFVWKEWYGVDWVQRASEKTPGWIKAGYLKCDEAFAVIFYLDILGAIESSSVPAFDTKTSASVRDLEQTRFIISRLLVPSIGRMQLQGQLTCARRSAAAAAIAALRFRKTEGRWPDNLEELVGRYIESVPLDPMTEKPLVYTVLDDGIMVYSVGENRRDDGGKPLLVKTAESSRGGCDDYAGFRIWDGVPREEGGGEQDP